jgi:hypothetical protein
MDEWGWRNPTVEWGEREGFEISADLKFRGIYLGWGVRTEEVVRRGRRRRRWIGSRRRAPFRFHRPSMFAGFEIGCAAPRCLDSAICRSGWWEHERNLGLSQPLYLSKTGPVKLAPSTHEATYSLPLFISIIVGVFDLYRIRATFISSNKFIKKLDLKIFLIILIIYYKY